MRPPSSGSPSGLLSAGLLSAVLLSLACLCVVPAMSEAVEAHHEPMALRVELRQSVGGRQLDAFTIRASPAPSTLDALHELLRERIALELSHQCEGDTCRADQELSSIATSMEVAVELYDPRRQQFAPLSTIDELLGHARRARLSVSVLNALELFPSESREHLALPSRMFDVDPESFTIDGRRVFIGEVGNSGKGTGLTTWDGSVVLAKFLEYQSRETHELTLQGARVLELGSGTGLVGLSAALLGAKEVVLTDLDYTMENLARNVATTLQFAADSGREVESSVSTRVLDWFAPPSDLGGLDVILASDVVWVEELIAPLVQTMDVLLRHSSPGARVLMAHQTRSSQSDRVLFAELKCCALRVRRVPTERLHPSFVSDRIFILEIDRATRVS
jgi:predicted nicotinamide N-methyase